MPHSHCQRLPLQRGLRFSLPLLMPLRCHFRFADIAIIDAAFAAAFAITWLSRFDTLIIIFTY